MVPIAKTTKTCLMQETINLYKDSHSFASIFDILLLLNLFIKKKT